MATKKSAKAKPVLKVTTETVHSVAYYELDEFIKKVTGHDFECVSTEEWGNDSQHHFTVTDKPSAYDLKDWVNFKKDGMGAGCYMLGSILDGLCSEGYIKPGNYSVNVCW